MATLSDTQIADLVAGTLRNLGRGKFQQIAQKLQRYEVMGKWLKMEPVEEAGMGIQRTLMLKTADVAKHVGLYGKDTINVADVLTQMQINWRHANTHWVYNETEVLEQAEGETLVLKIIKPRRANAMLSLADQLEVKAWACPAIDNTVDPYGLPYWIVKNASAGFNGGAPSGHTTVAGIIPANYPNWKNYTGTYATVNKVDLVKTMRTVHRYINWKSPIDINDYRGAGGQNFRLYVNQTLMSGIEDIGEAQNENLGRDIGNVGGDIGKLDGELVFKKHPIIWIPQLDADTQDPIYFVDHSTFQVVVLKGANMRESAPIRHAESHLVWVIWTDMSYNFICIDRRSNAVLYKA